MIDKVRRAIFSDIFIPFANGNARCSVERRSEQCFFLLRRGVFVADTRALRQNASGILTCLEYILIITVLVLSFGVFPFGVGAQSRSNILSTVQDERGKPELVVCSQNLANYGALSDVRQRTKGMNQERLEEKELGLLRRFLVAKCDVIAVQEILGGSKAVGQKALDQLAELIRARTNRKFLAFAAPSNNNALRNGFLVAEDRAEVLNTISYSRVELPKISKAQKPREFVRGPFELQLRTRPRDSSPSKIVTLVNFHFKSRAYNSRDPAELQWETYRMEMAEGLRQIVLNRHEESFAIGSSILVLLGDRNSNFDVASARLLEGSLTLAHFQGEAPCRLSKRGVPLCQPGAAQPARLFSVLTGDRDLRNQPGTYRYKNTYSWLDDILLPAESMAFGYEKLGSEGEFASGLLYEPKEASDHALVYLALNW